MTRGETFINSAKNTANVPYITGILGTVNKTPVVP